MSDATTSSDLYTNKDALLSISTFLSLKQLGLLREISKQFNSWLSDYSSFSWKKRIESAFPTTFKAVLQEDMKDQIAKLQKFDTLVDSGHQVSFFSLPSLLDVASVEVNQKYQVPWARTLFLIVYNKTSAMVFDAVSGKEIYRFDLAELTEIEIVLFDIKDHKIGFVGGDTVLMKVYSFENNELKFVTDYSSDVLDCEIFPQIYGENVIVDDESRLEWHSLSSGNPIKKIDLPVDAFFDEDFCLELSFVKPEIYIVKTEERTYSIQKIDCTLQAAEPVEVHRARLGIEMDNCGDGVESTHLIETEHGRILNVYLMGTGDRAFRAYDLDAQKIVESLHFGVVNAYNTIQYNPGSHYYSIKSDSGVVAIMESGKMYEDDAEKDDGSEEEEDECDRPDPTKGAYFKFKTDVQNYKWLNKDLFTLNTIIDNKPRCQFFSISKRRIIGAIDEDITDVFIADKTIVAFTTTGDIYRVKLDMDFDAKYQGKADAEKMAVENETTSKNKKRKASEMSNKGVQKIRKAAKYS